MANRQTALQLSHNFKSLQKGKLTSRDSIGALAALGQVSLIPYAECRIKRLLC